MSRFASMDAEARRHDPAFRSVPDCSHPDSVRKSPDNGGPLGVPSFYCQACNRLVFRV